MELTCIYNYQWFISSMDDIFILITHLNPICYCWWTYIVYTSFLVMLGVCNICSYYRSGFTQRDLPIIILNNQPRLLIIIGLHKFSCHINYRGMISAFRFDYNSVKCVIMLQQCITEKTKWVNLTCNLRLADVAKRNVVIGLVHRRGKLIKFHKNPRILLNLTW